MMGIRRQKLIQLRAEFRLPGFGRRPLRSQYTSAATLPRLLFSPPFPNLLVHGRFALGR
jgi:hypothetical protein